MRRIAELCDLAQGYGIRPTIEFMAYRGVSSLADALRVAAMVAHSNFGICIDALHLQRSGGKPEDLACMDPTLLGSLQLCDAPLAAPDDLAFEARCDRLYPGEGALPLCELLRYVPIDVPISVEVPNVAPATRSTMERAQKAVDSTRRLLAVARPSR